MRKGRRIIHGFPSTGVEKPSYKESVVLTSMYNSDEWQKVKLNSKKSSKMRKKIRFSEFCPENKMHYWREGGEDSGGVRSTSHGSIGAHGS